MMKTMIVLLMHSNASVPSDSSRHEMNMVPRFPCYTEETVEATMLRLSQDHGLTPSVCAYICKVIPQWDEELKKHMAKQQHEVPGYGNYFPYPLSYLVSHSCDRMPLRHMASRRIKDPQTDKTHYVFQVAYVPFIFHRVHLQMKQSLLAFYKDMFSQGTMGDIKKCLESEITKNFLLIMLFKSKKGILTYRVLGAVSFTLKAGWLTIDYLAVWHKPLSRFDQAYAATTFRHIPGSGVADFLMHLATAYAKRVADKACTALLCQEYLVQHYISRGMTRIYCRKKSLSCAEWTNMPESVKKRIHTTPEMHDNDSVMFLDKVWYRKFVAVLPLALPSDLLTKFSTTVQMSTHDMQRMFLEKVKRDIAQLPSPAEMHAWIDNLEIAEKKDKDPSFWPDTVKETVDWMPFGTLMVDWYDKWDPHKKTPVIISMLQAFSLFSVKLEHTTTDRDHVIMAELHCMCCSANITWEREFQSEEDTTKCVCYDLMSLCLMHVGLDWMICSPAHADKDWDEFLEDFPLWASKGPEYAEKLCSKLDGRDFEQLHFYARDDRLKLKTAIKRFKYQTGTLELSDDEEAIKRSDTTDAFTYLARTHKVVLFWLKRYFEFYKERRKAIAIKMNSTFEHLPDIKSMCTKTPKEKQQEREALLMAAVGGNWTPRPPKHQSDSKREKEIKAKLAEAAVWWGDWLFQFGMQELEYVNVAERKKGKKPLPLCANSIWWLKNKKKKDPENHWVGHSLVKATDNTFDRDVAETGDADNADKTEDVAETETGAYPPRKKRSVWRSVQRVIEPDWFQHNNKAIPDSFLERCRNQPNCAHILSKQSRAIVKKIGLVNGYYSQIVRIKRTTVEDDTDGSINVIDGFHFEGGTLFTEAWVSLTETWLQENFMTREPKFFKELFVESDNATVLFDVPVGAQRQHKEVEFPPDAIYIKYQQRDQSTCCFASLASAFHAIGDQSVELAVSSRIQTSLEVVPSEYPTRMDYAKDVMNSHKSTRSHGEPRLKYRVEEYTVWDNYDLFQNVSNHVTLVQMQDTSGSLSHCISVAGKWLFDANVERTMPMTYENLDVACTDPGQEEKSQFVKVYRALKFIPLPKNKVTYKNLM